MKQKSLVQVLIKNFQIVRRKEKKSTSVFPYCTNHILSFCLICAGINKCIN